MLLAESVLTPGQIWAPVVSAVLVAGIAFLGTIITVRSNKEKAKVSANEAGDSATKAETAASIAADAAKALEVKNLIIEGLEERVAQLEQDKRRSEERCDQMERLIGDLRMEMDEMTEALRNASLLERGLSGKPMSRQHGSTPHSQSGSHPISPEPSS